MSESPVQATDSESQTLDYDASFDLSDADLVVMSSDGVRFKAYRGALETSSSVLAERLVQATPNRTQPVLHLPEDANTVRSLLSAILPSRQRSTKPMRPCSPCGRTSKAASIVGFDLTTHSASSVWHGMRVSCSKRLHQLELC
ncbi:hypothetical protein BC834DRAFT_271473 [Gloeopeniophorella convolvens]|nr:hypothetical protein BC834DRAFT_271473 [Gloeopeniophorella convolvens]